jgi:hypothetical protein
VLNDEGALDEIKSYCDFMDNEILPLYTRLGGQELDLKVRFADLEYLFRCDDYLYYPKGTQQFSAGWRDYFCICKPDPSELCEYSVYPDQPGKDRRGQAELRLPCYYIDFDGEYFTVVKAVVIIYSFEGERDVTSLPIFPVRCMPDAEQILRDCQE